MNKFAKDIHDKVSHLLDGYKLLPTFGQEDERKTFTFLAQPRVEDSLQKIQNTLEHLKSGIQVEQSNFVKNGHEFTLGDNKVKIIYVTNRDEFEFCFDVSSYGVNLILGKILKRLGLKLTNFGLLYEEKLGIENHQSKVGEFLITGNSEKLFSLLKLDYNTFKAGFETKDEFFTFLATCPYLNQRIFTEPKKEHKLLMHQEFQAYLIANPIAEPHKKLTFEEIDEFFDDIDFMAAIERLKEKERRKREAVEKFNGRVILDYYPDFDRKKIGTSMGYFKYSFGGVEEYRDFLAENDIDAVMNKFKEIVKF